MIGVSGARLVGQGQGKVVQGALKGQGKVRMKEIRRRTPFFKMAPHCLRCGLHATPACLAGAGCKTRLGSKI